MLKHFFRTIWWDYNLRGIVWRNYSRFFPVSATKHWYKKSMGVGLDLESPKTISEKIQYLKLNDYYHNPIVRQCADKYAVRDYVKEKGCGEILNELYAVYNNPLEIKWERMPEEFVLKCNHGCGGNIICNNKETLDKEAAKRDLSHWLKQEYGLERVEFSYEGIPRKIICEKLIKTESGGLPLDYKFFCSYGIPKIIEVISGRTKKGLNLDYFYPDWTWIPVKKGDRSNAGQMLPRPKMLRKMLDYASKLSEDFPLVRVDLYCEFDKIIFGELTFCPNGGCIKLDPPEYGKIFGDLFPIIDHTEE